MARIKLRRDTAANWMSVNPILDLAEPGYETDTRKIKYGNGVDNWDALPYFTAQFLGGVIPGPLEITADLTPTIGSLSLSGNIPEPGDPTTSIGLLQVGPGLNFEDTGMMASFVHNTNSYAQVVVGNNNGGDIASADFIVGNDVGGSVYGDFGINSSGFVGAGVFDSPNSVYLYSAGSELTVGTKEPYTLTLATNSSSRVEISNTGEVEFQPASKVHILNTTDSTSFNTGALIVEGGLAVGRTIVANDNLYLGVGAVDVPLTDPVIVVKQGGDDFIQAALVNSTPTGSADFIAYGSNSTEDEGWTSMGFTGPNFNDPAYNITEPGEGYVFVQGKPSSHGSLVLCTGDQGTDKDIVFGTGGFAEANERMRLEHTNQSLHVYMTTPSVNTMTGAIVLHGGIGVDENINVGGTINKVIITPPASPATLTLGSGKTFTVPESVTLPNTVGANGSVLTANGSGTLTYTAQANLAVTKLPIVKLSGVDHTATVSNNIICLDPVGAPRIVTLPDDAPQGKIYTIKKTTLGSTITVNTNNVFCTIDGASTYTLNNLEAVTVVMGNDGVTDVYYVIGKVV